MRSVRTSTSITAALALTIGATALGAASPAASAADAPASAPESATAGPEEPIDHVVAISVDGLPSGIVEDMGAGQLPNLHRLLDEGAGTLNARNDVEETITLPNHSSMVTGRPIDGDGGHGVHFNSDNGRTMHRYAGEYVASMFDVVHDAGASTAMYTTKSKFDFLDRTWDGSNGAVDEVGADDGRDKIDYYHRSSSDSGAVTRLIQRSGTYPAEATFLHLSETDSAGHTYGWGSSRYRAALQRVDTQIGRVLDAIEDHPERSTDTAVVLTSDHGGNGTSHSTRTDPKNYTIPFVVWGPGIAAGDLYDQNATSRRDPGTSRPSYSGTQPVRNGEVANVVTDLLTLPAVEGSTFNQAQDLDVF